MSTWNYRIIKNNQGEYAIHEVYYDGDMIGFTENAIAANGETVEELKADLKLMDQAFNLSVLQEVDGKLVEIKDYTCCKTCTKEGSYKNCESKS